ncbi:twitch domain-containing radical SAM protein [Halobacteriovorax sp. HLS]|uniref:twitch domain-containing radical SAM protein n=1 Tax=Halobacteriovorax sp. HLS TaxID=2234000 RepID=UPI000FDC7E12|nr:twitch domain-containing radical SAM protein [Halobacteriovorax sp. HLS]
MKSHDNKSICIQPWISLALLPSGHFTHCCIAYKDRTRSNNGGLAHIESDTVFEAWESNFLRTIRERMTNGEYLEGCESCYVQEKAGKDSYRILNNREWKKRLGEESYKKIYSKVDNLEIQYIDLRLGNQCNLKCRMCNPHNSSLISKEWNAIDKTQDAELYNSILKKSNIDNDVNGDWDTNSFFWCDIEKIIPNLKKAYLTGGEPTIINSNYIFMSTCVRLGYAKDIDLVFNLNLNTLPKKFLDLISEFRSVNAIMSIDGYGEVNDYIRSGSRWKNVQRNIHKLASKKSRDLFISVSPVVQVYNLLSLHKLMYYLLILQLRYRKYFFVDLIYCLEPVFLDVKILPPKMKKKALVKLYPLYFAFLFIYQLSGKRFHLFTGVKGLVNYLKSNMNYSSDEKIEDFLAYTKILDKNRGQSFEKSLPSTYGYLRSYEK